MESEEDLGNISDELLALAGGDRKRKSNHDGKPSAKRRKPEAASSDMEFESEEEGDILNPYPLEGQYKDEEDRQRLLELPEVEREAAIAQRLEEKQRIQDKLNLDRMVKAQNGPDSDKAKRKLKSGMSKEKSRALDQLKAKRKAKDDRATRPVSKDASFSPVRKHRSSSSSEYSGDEDGQGTSKLDDDKTKSSLDTSRDTTEILLMSDLEKIRLTRDMITKHCLAPWFEEYIKGTWIRYLIGSEHGQNVYRLCEVINLGSELVRPYAVDHQMVNQTLELRHGKSTRVFPMDKVSNSPWVQKEFDRLIATTSVERVKMPSKRSIEQKISQMHALVSKQLSEEDVTAMIARKNLLQPPRQSAQQLASERARLYSMRSLALKRNDFSEAALIDEQINLMESERGGVAGAAGDNGENAADKLALVNERNRKANLEDIRKAEAIDSERKRKERKERAAAAALALGRKATPDSRSGTPANGPPSVPVNAAKTTVIAVPTGKRNIDAIMVNSIEVDLGDF